MPTTSGGGAHFWFSETALPSNVWMVPQQCRWLQSVKEHSSTKTATALLLRVPGWRWRLCLFLQILLSPEPAAHPPACRRNLEHLPAGVHPLHMPLGAARCSSGDSSHPRV